MATRLELKDKEFENDKLNAHRTLKKMGEKFIDDDAKYRWALKQCEQGTLKEDMREISINRDVSACCVAMQLKNMIELGYL